MAFYQDYFSDTFKKHQHLFVGENFIEKNFNAGELLCTDKAYGQEIFYIKSGRVKLICSNEEGKLYSVLRMSSGNIMPLKFQDDSTFDFESNMNIEALCPVTVISFSPETFHNIIRENQDLSLNCLEHSIKINNLYQYEIMSLTISDSRKRICEMLYMLNLYGTSTDTTVLDISQKELADGLGISRIQLGRVLKELRDVEIISTRRNKITVINPEKLKKMIE